MALRGILKVGGRALAAPWLAAKLDAVRHDALQPASVRSLIRSRSKSAIPASNVASKRPCDELVSHRAWASPIDRKAAPASPMAWIRLSSSRVERPKRSSLGNDDDIAALERRHQLAQVAGDLPARR
jgi:hypothetical protein